MYSLIFLVEGFINNEIIHESSITIQSTNWTTFSVTKKKIQELADRTNTIINQIKKISKDNKKGFISKKK